MLTPPTPSDLLGASGETKAPVPEADVGSETKVDVSASQGNVQLCSDILLYQINIKKYIQKYFPTVFLV